MSIVGGFPMGVTEMMKKGRFSMFPVAPLMSTALPIELLMSGTIKMLEAAASG
jgi:hypothetical protein